MALAPGGGPLLGCFLFQHGPVKCVVILVVQSPERHKHIISTTLPTTRCLKWQEETSQAKSDRREGREKKYCSNENHFYGPGKEKRKRG